MRGTSDARVELARRRAIVDVVMPARDEERTVAANVVAARGCRYVREVIVVDDGSGDATAERAHAAGARVIRRAPSAGSKAHAMRDGVNASDATHILFVDADCIGLTAEHLETICEPVLRGHAEMSLGIVDWGWLNGFILRIPPLSGLRIVPRWVWEAIPEQKLAGYTIEGRLNEVIGWSRLRTSARTMIGLRHRTKREKLGRREGLRQTVMMYAGVFGMLWPVGDVPLRTIPRYLRGLTIERAAR
jgi:glycosyltransferase involved in cell wall biosynthesis